MCWNPLTELVDSLTYLSSFLRIGTIRYYLIPRHHGTFLVSSKEIVRFTSSFICSFVYIHTHDGNRSNSNYNSKTCLLKQRTTRNKITTNQSEGMIRNDCNHPKHRLHADPPFFPQSSYSLSPSSASPHPQFPCPASCCIPGDDPCCCCG